MSGKSSPNWLLKIVLLVLPIIVDKVTEFIQDLIDQDDRRELGDK